MRDTISKITCKVETLIILQIDGIGVKCLRCLEKRTTADKVIFENVFCEMPAAGT